MSSSLGVAKIYNPKVDSANVALIRKKVYNYIRPGMMRWLGGEGWQPGNVIFWFWVELFLQGLMSGKVRRGTH